MSKIVMVFLLAFVLVACLPMTATTNKPTSCWLAPDHVHMPLSNFIKGGKGYTWEIDKEGNPYQKDYEFEPKEECNESVK